jgi:NAD-dependent dihydropyrimidine dehydrogenase PreA subunit
MPPVIDRSKCDLCQVCVENCPGDVFAMNEAGSEVLVARPMACWHCGACEVDCPPSAIYIKLPLMILA